MRKESHSILKIELRKKFLLLRQSISATRREIVSLKLRDAVQTEGNILSFCSFGSEIDLSLLNNRLISEKRLLLPRLEKDLLVPYQIFDLTTLARSPLGYLEPNPNFASKIELSDIQLILVPGLVFDIENFRLGYGKGHYDRLLKDLQEIETLGIGFKEQQMEGLLPHDPWDIPVKHCLFF
jgi:5-formyltetrahydrofolate cyclo-ligase